MFDPRTQLIKGVTRLHRMMFDLSKGRLGGRAGGMPVIKLTTTGRRSGRPRDAMLTAPIHDDDGYVLVASFGGADHHPAWFLNLRDNPEVTVTVGDEQQPMTARVLSTEEKARLWPEVVAAYDQYAGYQEKTDRDIPLVRLEPRT